MNPTLIFVALVAIFGAAHLAPVGNNDQNGQNGQNGISMTLQQLEVVAGQQFALLNVAATQGPIFLDIGQFANITANQIAFELAALNTTGNSTDTMWLGIDQINVGNGTAYQNANQEADMQNY